MRLNKLRVLKLLLALVFAQVILACATGNCRKEELERMQKTENKGQERVFVYKYDGSLQCGMGKVLSAEDMKKELKGIEIFSLKSKNDGLMRIQLCGSPTGQAHVFEILKVDLEKAQKKGFKEWTFD